MGFSLSDVPVVGGIWDALTGKSNFNATAHAVNTKPGEQAIAMQAQQQAAQNAAMQNSIAAGARGPNAALGMREAQRRASMGNLAAMQGSTQAGLQLQQSAIQNQLNAQMQAQSINAQTASANAQGLGRLAGAAVMGGALLMSDEKAKVAADAKAAGVDLSPADWEAMGYGPSQFSGGGVRPDAGRRDIPAMAVYSPGYDSGARVQWMSQLPPLSPLETPPAGPGQLQPMQGGILSDERAKHLEGENAKLKAILLHAADGPTAAGVQQLRGMAAPPAMAHLPVPSVPAFQPRDEASAAQYGAHWLDANREAAMRDKAAQDAYLAQVQQAQAAQRAAQDRYVLAQTGPAMPTGPRVVGSDEEMKEMRGMHDPREGSEMEFPNGVKPVTYEYKPGMGDGPGMHVGLLAQDLEKSPEGATTVKQDPMSGMKMVDTGHLTTLNTAKLAEMDARLKKAGI